MATIKEIAESVSGWVLRREGLLKSADLPSVIENALKEQRKIDVDKACEILAELLHDNGQIWSIEACIKSFRKAMED